MPDSDIRFDDESVTIFGTRYALDLFRELEQVGVGHIIEVIETGNGITLKRHYDLEKWLKNVRNAVHEPAGSN